MQDGQGQGPKQLLSERIKNATNILVTVSRDPSVDELSAALALTLILNKMDKHGTAVFSGKIPPAIEFLNPEKTFEGTVDSLRDFIIALDKNKADRLRYKVEDDVVRIFITPYRTTISDKDLAFSQGDFNVELVVALGVEKKEDLDEAISAHGRILHDATVTTINASGRQSGLGSIDWTDASAGSYCEMLMSLSESLKSGVLDEQIATALLTGIVAATERFSNTKTSPKVMTMAAQLMAAGANQQLIATKLEEGDELPGTDGSRPLKEGSSQKVAAPAVQPEQKAADGEMHVDHEKPDDAEQAVEKATELADSAESSLDQVTARATAAVPTLSVEDLKKDLAAAHEEVEQAAQNPIIDKPSAPPQSDWRAAPVEPANEPSEPLFGGTLNATADEAHDAKEREDRLNRNRTLLSHDGSGAPQTPLNSTSPGAVNDEPPAVDPFAEPPRGEPSSGLHYEAIDTHGPTVQPLSSMPSPEAPAQQNDASHIPTLSELEAQAHTAAAASANPVTDARAAVNAALETLPFNPANEPLSAAGAQPMPGADLHAAPTAPAVPGDGFTPPPATASSPLPPPPPLPDFSTLPPLPADAPVDDASQSPASPPPSGPAPSTDPGQFKLPGQP